MLLSLWFAKLLLHCFVQRQKVISKNDIRTVSVAATRVFIDLPNKILCESFLLRHFFVLVSRLKFLHRLCLQKAHVWSCWRETLTCLILWFLRGVWFVLWLGPRSVKQLWCFFFVRRLRDIYDLWQALVAVFSAILWLCVCELFCLWAVLCVACFFDLNGVAACLRRRKVVGGSLNHFGCVFFEKNVVLAATC